MYNIKENDVGAYELCDDLNELRSTPSHDIAGNGTKSI